MKEYMAWLEEPEGIKGPQEMSLTIKELTHGRCKYLGHNVKATVSPTAIPGADTLRVRRANGLLLPAPWYIKITEELGEYWPGRPYSGIVD